jgi:hypothetical protein
MSLLERYVKDSARVSNHGAVILLALVFTLLLSIIAATVMQSSILQLHMAGNDQLMEEALHKAQGIAAEIAVEHGNFILSGDVGDANCPIGSEMPGCDRHQLPVPDSARAAEGFILDYRVTRQDPLLWKGFPVRENEAFVSSATGFDAVLFEVDVQIDGSGMRLGSAHVVQGIAIRVPAFR